MPDKMKCFNTKKLYCQCEFVKDGKCPILEVKKLIAKCRRNPRFSTREFINVLITLKLIEMFDEIKVDG